MSLNNSYSTIKKEHPDEVYFKSCLDLPRRWCLSCGAYRLFSEDASFCLTCGAYRRDKFEPINYDSSQPRETKEEK